MAVDVTLLNNNSLDNIETNFQRVETALQDAVSRSGTTPNQMNADLDLNNNDLLNVNIIDAEDINIEGVNLSTRLQEVVDAKDTAVAASVTSVNASNSSAASAGNAAVSAAAASNSAVTAATEANEAEYWAEQALENATSLVIASETEAEAGTINTKGMTPLRTKQAAEFAATSDVAGSRFSISVPRSTLGLVEIGGSLSISDTTMADYLQDALDEIARPESPYKQLFIDAVPEEDGWWGIDRTLVMQSGTTIAGVGRKSHLKNTRTTVVIPGDGRVFDYANMPTQGPNAFGLGLSYAIDPAAAGDASVFTVTAADAGNFVPGEPIWVRTAEQTSGPIYAALQMNLVDFVDAGTGEVGLKYTLSDAIAGSAPVICKTDGVTADGLGTVRRITKDIVIRDLRMTTTIVGEGWEAAGGTIDGQFINLDTHSRGPIYTNALSHCYFNNVGGTFRNRFLEVAGYSDWNVFENTYGRFEEGIAPTAEALISFGENSNYNRMTGFIINGDDCLEGQLVRTLFGSYNTIEKGKCMVRGLTSSLLSFNNSTGKCVGNAVQDLEIWAGTPSRLLLTDHSASAEERDNSARRIKFFGGPTTSEAISIRRSKNFVAENIEFDAGTIQILSTADSPVLDRFTTKAANHSINIAAPDPGNGRASVRNFRSASTKTLRYQEGVGADTTATSSPTDVDLVSYTFPAETFTTNDLVNVEGLLFPTGTNDTKTITVTVNGVTAHTYTLAAGDTSPVSLDFVFDVVVRTTTKRLLGTLVTNSDTRSFNYGASINADTTPITIAIRGRTANAADALTLRRPKMSVVRKYENI